MLKSDTASLLPSVWSRWTFKDQQRTYFHPVSRHLLTNFFKFLAFQEVHILHVYEHDFYGHEMIVVILGYIRPELDYTSRGMCFLAGNQNWTKKIMKRLQRLL